MPCERTPTKVLTSAAEAGADPLRMMEVSRHKRIEAVCGYVRHPI